MGEYKGYLVLPKDIHRIWGHIEPLIQKGLDTISENNKLHYLTTDDYRAWFHDTMAQLFIVVDENTKIRLIGISEIGHHANRTKVLHCILIAGDNFKDCYQVLQDTAEEVARREECVRMVLTGRKGMQPALETMGWQEIKTKHKIVMMKDL